MDARAGGCYAGREGRYGVEWMQPGIKGKVRVLRGEAPLRHARSRIGARKAPDRRETTPQPPGPFEFTLCQFTIDVSLWRITDDATPGVGSRRSTRSFKCILWSPCWRSPWRWVSDSPAD